jgi:hypothetical protein
MTHTVGPRRSAGGPITGAVLGLSRLILPGHDAACLDAERKRVLRLGEPVGRGRMSGPKEGLAGAVATGQQRQASESEAH